MTQDLRERVRALRCFWRRVPELPLDIHDLEGLSRVADALTTDEPEGDAHG